MKGRRPAEVVKGGLSARGCGQVQRRPAERGGASRTGASEGSQDPPELEKVTAID